MRPAVAASLICTSISAASGQQPGGAETPALQAPSVKALESPAARRESIKATAGRLTLQNVTLSSCIKYALWPQDFRFSGPKWLTNVSYAIEGKAPGAAPSDRLPLMFQNLPVTRFHPAYDSDGEVLHAVEVPDMAGILAKAIQDQLGLKLESKEPTVEVLVVDRIEKNPAEN